MTRVCPAWSSRQRLQNKVLRSIGNFPRRTPTGELHMAFNIPYVYDFITQLCRQQAEVIQNQENATLRNIHQGEAMQRICKRLKLGGGQTCNRVSI
jgi:hypothetical protein